LEDAGKLLEGREALRQAAELAPDDPEVQERLNRVRSRIREAHPFRFPSGDQATTLAEWVDYLLRKPDEASSALRAGELERWLEKIQERPESARRLLTVREGHGLLWERLGRFLEEEALLGVTERTGLERVKRDTAELLEEADAHVAARRPVEARGLYLAVERRDPGHPSVAEGLRLADEIEREETVWGRVNKPGSRDGLGDYLKAYSQGHHANEARRRLEALVCVTEGEACLRRGEVEQARHAVERALSPSKMGLMTIGERRDLADLLGRICLAEAAAQMRERRAALLMALAVVVSLMTTAVSAYLLSWLSVAVGSWFSGLSVAVGSWFSGLSVAVGSWFSGWSKEDLTKLPIPSGLVGAALGFVYWIVDGCQDDFFACVIGGFAMAFFGALALVVLLAWVLG
jgi:hypothetical protein